MPSPKNNLAANYIFSETRLVIFALHMPGPIAEAATFSVALLFTEINVGGYCSTAK
jgi:hypothetical protein